MIPVPSGSARRRMNPSSFESPPKSRTIIAAGLYEPQQPATDMYKARQPRASRPEPPAVILTFGGPCANMNQKVNGPFEAAVTSAELPVRLLDILMPVQVDWMAIGGVRR